MVKGGSGGSQSGRPHYVDHDNYDLKYPQPKYHKLDLKSMGTLCI